MNKPVKKLMVYIDGTEQSITAAQYAICLASCSDAELIAHYVINIKAMDDLLKARIFLQDEELEYEHDMEADAERYLNYVSELAIAKGVTVTKKTSRGGVSKEIIDSIKEEDVDMLVIGELSHIRSRMDEFYDETERAMRSAPCSVLIVKDPMKVIDLYDSLV